MEQAKKNALSSARERFRAGLAGRARELRPLIAAFSSDPTARVARAALQRRLHTLLASAQLFEEPILVELLQRVVSRLDAVGLHGEAWRDADRQALAALFSRLSGSQAEVDADVTSVTSRSERERPASPLQGSAPPPPALPSRPSPGGPTHSMLLVRVLLVCSRPHAVALRALLEDAPVELLHAADPEQALALLHSALPACALVAAEFATFPDIDLVRRLRMDPVGRVDGVYLLAPAGAHYDAHFIRQSGADGVLCEPLTLEALQPLLERAMRGRGRGGLRSLRERPEGTVDEIASYVAEEVRIGIANGLRAGLAERIRLSDTRELTEAAWSAIGRVRSHLAAQSEGRVLFPGYGAASQGKPSSGVQEPALGPAAAAYLMGRRVLVVDDDPAVLWSFSETLREAGVHVLQARDGDAALELARRMRPHVILSDILMPKVDGFTLSRELRRDVLLARVPVILLSWKEDERTRELAPEIDGYLRKDAGPAKLLFTLAGVLSRHVQLWAALAEDGDISGRLEDVGAVALLETVAEVRPDACITVQDGGNLFEIELSADLKVAVTRTSTEGSLTRGTRALAQLLGATRGTFDVAAARRSRRSAHAWPLASALHRAAAEVSAALDAVCAARLPSLAQLTFDDDVLAYLLDGSAPRLAEVVEHFRSGATNVRPLLEDGGFTLDELESLLRELARRGAITGVWDALGDDMLAAAQLRRDPSWQGSARRAPGVLAEVSEPAAEPVPEFESESESDVFVLDDLPDLTEHLTEAPGELDDAAGSDEASVLVAEVEFISNEDEPAAEAEEGSAPQISEAVDPEAEVTVDLRTLSIPRAEIAVPERPRVSGVRLALSLAALAALGYLAAIELDDPGWLHSDLAQRMGRWLGRSPTPTAAPLERETSMRSSTDPEATWAIVLPYIDASRGVSVARDQGLLVIEHVGPELPADLEVDGRPMGKPPLVLAVAAGTHPLLVTQGQVTIARELRVHAGRTHVILLPLPNP